MANHDLQPPIHQNPPPSILQFPETITIISRLLSFYHLSIPRSRTQNTSISIEEDQPLCSCDGLILLSVSHKPFPFARNPSKSFDLWNPSIRAYKEIWPPFEFNDFGISGICYDSNIDDYRVIILWQYFQTLVLIYDSKSNSWNTISDPCYSILVCQSGVLVNGVLHWVMASKELCSWVIVYFDLVEDKLKEVPRPSFGDEDDKKIDLVDFGDGDKMIDLVVLRECLCVYRCVDREKVEIWEMKEYGKKESWTKLIVIPYLIDLQCLKPLFFTNNGEVLIEVDNRKILVYDPKDSTFRNVRSYVILVVSVWLHMWRV
ncbi:unnamed protein product [Camellia sinensis]